MRNFNILLIAGGALLLSLLTACVKKAGMTSRPTRLLEKRAKYMVLDTTLFSTLSNVKLTPGKVEKHQQNPLFGEEHDWELRFDNLYANVWYDEEDKLYKCWYNPFIIDLPTSETSEEEKKKISYNEARSKYGRKRETAVCYAYSRDGINWEKPVFNQYLWEGKPSNILLRQAHGAGIFKDPLEADSTRRYKMFFRNHASGEAYVAVAFSADGLHWSEPKNFPNINVWADTHNNAFWAPTLNKYVAITRDWDRENAGEIQHVRLVARTESPDFENWTDSEVILRGLEDHLQVYSMPVFYYHGIYIGLPSIFNTIEDRVHTELAWSKDTKIWHRVAPGTPLIPLSSKRGDYDWGCIYAAANPVFLENEIRLYYGASDGFHFNWRKGYLALATLRPDGFAGMIPVHAGEVGSLKTHPLSIGGNLIKLAADVEPKGYIDIAAILDGKKIPLGKLTSHEEPTLSLPQNILSATMDKSVQLEFTLYRSQLFAFQFEQQ